MTKKKTVSDLSKSGQVNSFTGGINTDLHPMLQPNDTLTDCLNGTLITYNGNENMLQNDMGNYELKNAKLPEGYIPMGIKEHQGVLYMILMNPITNKVQIGSYPSPQTIFEKNSNPEEYLISPVKIGKLEMVEQFSGLDDDQTKSSPEATAVWNVIDGDDALQSECLFSKLDLSKSSTVFTKDFHQNSFLNFGDKYLLNADSDNGEDPVFQTLEYFSIDKEKNITTIDENIVKDDSKIIDLVDNTDSSKFDDVLWNANGWLGARYKVHETEEISQQTSGSLQGVSDRLSITEYRKISDVTDCVINQKPFTYEFTLEGANFQNMIVDFEGFLKNNTDTAFITTNKHLYDDRLVEKKEWSGGCYLEGDYDLPLYKFENKYSYIGIIPELDDSDDSDDSDAWFDIVENNKEQAKSWFVQNFVEESFGSSRINGIVFPSIGDVKFKKVLDRLHNIKNASLYFTQTPFKALWETILETFGSSNCTFYFSKICNSEFIQYLSNAGEYKLNKYNANLPQEFVEYAWKSDPENVSTHITFDELHSYNSKKIRYYYDVDVEKWGLNGTYSPGETAIYKFADTDWKSAIRGITKYATEVIYPNDSDLIVVDYPTCNTVAYNISNLVRCKFIHKEQIEGVDKTLVPEVNSTIFGNVDKTFSVEISTDNGVGVDFRNITTSLEIDWVETSRDNTVIKPPKDLLGRFPVFNVIELPNIGGEDEPEDGWFKISPKLLEYGEINPLFLYQFSCINFQLKGNNNIEGLGEYVKNIRLTNESEKLKLLLDIDTRYYDKQVSVQNMRESVLLYLSKDFMFSTEFRAWKIFNGELTTYTKYYTIPINFLPSVLDSKFIVPESFVGSIVRTPVYISEDGKNLVKWDDKKKLTEWSDDFKQVLYTVPKKEKIVDGTLNISVQCQDDVKIATKISYDDETKYINVDKLGATFKFKTLGNSMNTITISSVPYRIDQDQNCLIYDNLIITDQINYFENYESKIEKFQYYKDGNEIKILLESSSSLQYQECYDSIDICVCDNGMLRSIPFTIPEKPEELDTYGNVLNFSLKIDTTEDFVFLLMNLDEDDSISVPIYTKLTEEKHDSLISKKILDFTQAYADDLISKNIEIDESFIENNNSGEMYVTAEKLDDKLKIIHSSQNEYYWYNGIGDFNSQSDGNKNKQIYFGKAEQLDSKINLTKLGINEGDIISIDGIPNREYSALTVTASNYDLFEKTEEGLFLKLKVTRGYNMTSYSIEDSASPIAMRKYLFHHGYHPITHSDIDFDWDKHPQIFEHFGWDSYKPNSFKMLYVAKANAYNSNVHLGVINDAGEGYDEKSESFTKGNVVTNKVQAENKIYQVVGKDNTSQLFTLVKATIDVDGSGLTIPLPKMKDGYYKYKCNKNKENKGTDRSIVLTRDSNGLEWKNKLKNAFAYASISAGVAALATVIVMGCIAAANAAAGAAIGLATIAAAGAAIPFVGWAVLAAAVIAASVWLLCKVTAGVDQEFEFFAMRGPAKRPLVIPLWGSHRGPMNAKGELNGGLKWYTLDDSNGYHPWYLDVDFAHAEELITYIMTHVYYCMPGPSVLLGNAGNSIKEKSTPIKITLHSVSESSLGLDKYKMLENSIIKTNNFTVLEGNVPVTFTYPNSKDVEIENNFVVTNQKVSYINTVNRVGIYYDTCENTEINEEIDMFIKNLQLHISGDNVDLSYSGDIWSNDQDAFGGNTGGRSAKLKCMTQSTYKRMMSGEFPKNNLPYIPIAYAVNPESKDPIMVKDNGWGNSNSYWGESERTYPSPTDGSPKKGSKYFDHIHWDTYSNEFKLTTNTNEI